MRPLRVDRILLRLPVWAVVALGGALGTVVRIVVVDLLGGRDGFNPGVATANVTGAFALGVVAVHPFHDRHVHHTRAFLGTGVLGAYTTFSAISVAFVDGTDAAQAWLTLGLSVLVGPVGAWAGLRLGRAGPSAGRGDPRQDEDDL